MSLLSQYRLLNEIDAFSIHELPGEKIPRGAVIEYTPAINERHSKFIDVHWEGRLYRVLLADVFACGVHRQQVARAACSYFRERISDFSRVFGCQ